MYQVLLQEMNLIKTGSCHLYAFALPSLHVPFLPQRSCFSEGWEVTLDLGYCTPPSPSIPLKLPVLPARSPYREQRPRPTVTLPANWGRGLPGLARTSVSHGSAPRPISPHPAPAWRDDAVLQLAGPRRGRMTQERWGPDEP